MSLLIYVEEHVRVWITTSISLHRLFAARFIGLILDELILEMLPYGANTTVYVVYVFE